MKLSSEIIVASHIKFDSQYSNESDIERMQKSYNETIEWLCKSKYFDKKRFIESQESTIEAILTAYLEGKKAFILEAPTGVGKSIIGIVVSESIRRYISVPNLPTSYVLTSSKMLQDQLNVDKDHFNLMWAVLKGQGNYECNFNGKNFIERDCKDLSISKANEIRECSANCGYIQDRNKAMVYHAAILSYAYWLTTMNFIYTYLGDYAPFKKRPVVIFDECHMLPEIVMGLFQNTITDRFVKTLEMAHECILNITNNEQFVNKSLNMIEDVKVLLPKLLDEKISIDEMFTNLQQYQSIVKQYGKLCTLTCNKYLPAENSMWNVYHKKIDLYAGKIRDYANNIAYFISENEDTTEYIVKTFETDKMGSVTMTLRSLREAEMIKSHVHKFCDFELFMSATVGDADVFAKSIGLDDYVYLYLDSTFDYSKSPIYNVGPPLSMAYKTKNANMGELMYRIQHVCERLHPNERGIVHTGNFEICKKFKEHIWNASNSPRRYLFYNDSKQKAEALRKLQNSPNAVIIGPSLLEGLDLKDDFARFLIFAKVPYPPLDEFNTKKMKLMPEWYGWKTMTNVMQGLGRGIRHKKDWCKSYLLDSCFEFLFQKTRAPRYITSRFDTINVGHLEQDMKTAIDEASGLFNYKDSNGEVSAPKPKQTIDSIDIESMMKETNDKEEWDDLPF